MMALPRGSLRTFLSSAKSNLHNAIISQQRVTLVIGNESADLDSITSALIFAFIRSNVTSTPLTNPSVNKHIPPSQYPPLYIPLLNIPRADLKIRPELTTLLPYANIEPSHLITLDDLNAIPPAGLNPDGRSELQPNNTCLILTDHNKLAGPLATQGFGDRVVGCIDHHVDEHTIPNDTGSEPRIITTAGSCTSLVIQYCRPAWDQLSTGASSASYATSGQDDASIGTDDDAVRRTWDAQIAKLAIASVLIDTSDLQDESKTTDVDREVVRYLEAKIALASGGTAATWDRDEFYQEINSAKKDLNSLSLDEVLRKDYKEWEVKGKKLGVSSVIEPLVWQIRKVGDTAAFVEQVKRFANQRALDLCCVMTTSTSRDGHFQREMLLWSMAVENDILVDAFAKQSGGELGLEKWSDVANVASPDVGAGKLAIWWQREVKKSRKQVAPMLKRALEG